jgi:hypothetical protein
MAVIAVGGQSRKVGKSAVVAGLIRALPQYAWTAIKISGHGHDAAHGKVLISHETDGSGHTDTARFLEAGAERVFWVRGGEGGLEQAIPRIRQITAEASNTIIESNRIMRFLDPDLYLLVLHPAIEDFKDSAREFLPRVSAFIVNSGDKATAKAGGFAAKGAAASATPAFVPPSLPPRPSFPIRPPDYVTPELLAFIRERLVMGRVSQP